MNAVTRFLLIGFSSALLISCGGGGGDGVAPAVTVNPAELTSQNAPLIAASVVQTTLEGGGLGSFAGVGSGTGGILRDPDSQLFAKLGLLQGSRRGRLAIV